MTTLHTVTLEDKGYCFAQGMHDNFKIGGRTYSAGFSKDSRITMGGPIVPGRHGWLNQNATVISAVYIPENNTDAEIGDLIEGPEGEIYRIEVTPRASKNNSDYLRLVKLS